MPLPAANAHLKSMIIKDGAASVLSTVASEKWGVAAAEVIVLSSLLISILSDISSIDRNVALEALKAIKKEASNVEASLIAAQ